MFMKLMGNQKFSIHRQLWGHFFISRLTSILRLQVSMTFREMIRTPFSQADSKVHDVLSQSYDFHDDRTNVYGKSVTYKYLLQVSLKVVKSYKYHFGDLFVVLTFWCDRTWSETVYWSPDTGNMDENEKKCAISTYFCFFIEFHLKTAILEISER